MSEFWLAIKNNQGNLVICNNNVTNILLKNNANLHRFANQFITLIMYYRLNPATVCSVIFMNTKVLRVGWHLWDAVGALQNALICILMP